MSEYRSKPDPEEPWRYVCPECGNQVYRAKHNHGYYCETCQSGGYAKDELYDKKRGERIT